MYDNSACSVADDCTRRPTREATASAVPWRCPCACMHEVWNTCSSVSKVDVSWLSAFKVRFMSITDKVRYIRITDKVRYTRNTDFVYNGQKNAGPNWYVIRVQCLLYNDLKL